MLLGMGLARASPTDAVNAVIGDRSAQGAESTMSEKERLVTHLRFVEKMLRARKTTHLSHEKRQARLRVLQRLREYRLRGQFPVNTYWHNRTPVFVDDNGVRCAVGAIAEPDIGTAEIENIAMHSRLAYIADIESPALQRWAEDSGLTSTELAMIQPTYHERRPVIETPSYVQSAARRLNFSWNVCAADVYPVQIVGLPVTLEVGFDVLDTKTPSQLSETGRQGLQADLSIAVRWKELWRLRHRSRKNSRGASAGSRDMAVHPRGPVGILADSAQNIPRAIPPRAGIVRRFVSCVHRRFQGGRYSTRGPILLRRRYPLAGPRQNRLTTNSSYLYFKMQAAQVDCKDWTGGEWRLKVSLKQNGRTSSVKTSLFSARGTNAAVPFDMTLRDAQKTTTCVEETLRRTLRFRRSSEPNEIAVTVPRRQM